ncbi:hypothetical protein ACOKFD_14180 [Flagellimonas sp. S174]|uniref:hypothetical protein n=1 Tax=Flagellimonas sp. S174 TaxID=3410790 RepID=UPI003BF5F808
MIIGRIKVKELSGLKSPKKVENRLNALGHIQKVRLNLNQNTINFEYSTFRDLDTLICELRKMGLFVLRIYPKRRVSGSTKLKA